MRFTAVVTHAEAPLILPDAEPAPRKPTVALFAALVPIIGAVGLWIMTGSVFMLWFAVLGPLIVFASIFDARRAERTARRRSERALSEALPVVRAEVIKRQARERATKDIQDPAAWQLLLNEAAIWQAPTAGPPTIVVGRGQGVSDVRVTGGQGEQADELRNRAHQLPDAPLCVPALHGLAIVGPHIAATAVIRGLLAQLALLYPPGRLHFVPAESQIWLDQLPHAANDDGVRVIVRNPSNAVPVERSPQAAIVIAHVPKSGPLPPGCAAVLTLTGPDTARLDVDGHTVDITVQGIGASQAVQVARDLTLRAQTLAATRRNPIVSLASVLAAAPEPHRGGLSAVVGHDGRAEVILDLVADGPHAIVAGVTGSGKSELLITWVSALCARHSTDQVNFVLADFKGGTAFDSLSALPHVAAVLTDLDGSGARRALESLRAEVRWREESLAAVGARDIADPQVKLPRLVIVVDEFAALMAAQPELAEVFSDVAARGRALGMHLILGTQRVAGIIREGLLANCPLRVSLRVTDPLDSRAVVGTDEAAHGDGTREGRGIAFIRRSQDARPRTVRVALTSAEDIRDIAAGATGGVPRTPWLPELPLHLQLRDVRAATEHVLREGEIVIGLSDKPSSQSRGCASVKASDRGVLVVGAGGTGKTTLLELIAEQSAASPSVWVSDDLELAWDMFVALAENPPIAGTILIDNVDAIIARFPPEYAHVAAENLCHIARATGAYRLIVTAQRVTGAVSRCADLLPKRALFALPSRTDYIAAGGVSAHFEDSLPAGRMRWGSDLVHVAVPATHRTPAPREEPPLWQARVPVTGFLHRPGAAIQRCAEMAARAGCRVLRVHEASQALHSGDFGERPLAIIGDGEQWQRDWRVLQTVRAEHDLVVDATCAGDLRLVSADRSLAPYCHAGRGRAWLMAQGGTAQRIRLPAEDR